MTDENSGDFSYEFDTADVWKKKGDEYVKANDFQNAITCYSTAIEIDPNYVGAWNNLGYSYFKLGRLDEAKKCKDKINALKAAQTDVQTPRPTQPPPKIQPAQPPPASTPKIQGSGDSYQQNNLLIGLFIGGLVCAFIPIIGFIFVLFIVIASAYFVYEDADAIGAGRAPGSWSPLALGILVLLFWLIALPVYILSRRSMYDKGQAAIREGRTEVNKSGGVVIVLIILGCVIIFIILAAVIAAFVFGMAGSVTNVEPETIHSIPPTVTAVTTAIIYSNSDKPRWGNLEVEDWDWTTGSYGTRYLAGTVKNLGSRKYDYAQIEFNVYDDSGAQIGSALDNINNLEPYGTWKFKALVFEDDATRASLKEITAF
jgi:hypothetical protein